MTDSNPKPDYTWTFSNGSVVFGERTIKVLVSDCLFFYSYSYFLFFKDFENGNATYTCDVSNDMTRGGSKECSITNQEIMLMEKMLKYRPEKDSEMPSLPILVGIAVIGMLVLVCIGFVVFKFFLNPPQEEETGSPPVKPEVEETLLH